MKLKALKSLLDKLSEQELNQELLYNSERYSVSGVVEKITKAKADLYYTGDDDPATLYTKKQLKDDLGMEPDEIETCEIEIPKGGFVLKF